MDPGLLGSSESGVQSPVIDSAGDTAAARTHTPPLGSQGATPQERYPPPKYLDPKWASQGLPDTQFHRDYPPDAWGEEASPNARVWNIYRDQKLDADKVLLESWNKTLDVLLIFAGLFSAVSTAFIIESYKSLQPDYTQYIAALFYAAAVTNNLTVTDGSIKFPPFGSIVSPDSFVNPSATQRWTNGLWFSSLVISLAVALLSILVKQWLDEYNGHITASAPTARQWARRHQLYYRGLTAWGVPTLISFLPLLLHIALFLFFAGLILFLRPLDATIASILLAMVVCVLSFYVLSLLTPYWRVECPSYTPLLAQARSAVTAALRLLLYLCSFDHRRRDTIYWYWEDGHDTLRHFVLACSSAFLKLLAAADRASIRLANLVASRSHDRFPRETRAISAQEMDLDGWALSNLITSTTDNDVIRVGVEAVGAVSVERTVRTIQRNLPEDILFDKILSPLYRSVPIDSTGFALLTYGRCLRSYLNLRLSGEWWQDYLQPSLPNLRPSLGIESMLLMLLASFLPFSHTFDCGHLVESLEELLTAQLVNNASHAQRKSDLRFSNGLSGMDFQSLATPHRTICLFSLALLCQHLSQPHVFSCALLIFCCANLSQADTDQQQIGMRHMRSLLEAKHHPISSFGNGCAHDANLEVLDALFAILATREQCGLTLATTRIVAHHVSLLSRPPRNQWSKLKWAQLSGFSAFLRSPDFELCVSPQALSFDMILLGRVELSGEEDIAESRRYWMCVAALLKATCNIAQSAIPAVPGLVMPFGSFVKLYTWGKLSWSHPSGTYDAALFAFLESACGVGTWAEESWEVSRPEHPLLELAVTLSSVLCHRQRLQLPDEALVRGFFTGTFVLHRFRRLLDDDLPTDYTASTLGVIRLARHCARLSPPAWQRICAQLLMTGEEGSGLRKKAEDFVGRINGELIQGDQLDVACTEECDCMRILPAATRSERQSRKRWRDCLLLRISASGSSPADVA